MTMEMVKSFIVFLMTSLIIRGAICYIRVCYYTNWSQFVPTYRFLPNRIPAQLCTHVVFAYADIRATNVTPTEFNDVEMYGRLNRLKRDRPSLQILLAVGGWAAGGEKFSRLVSSETSMTQFSDNLIAYLRRNNLDGVNIDWQYPTSRERGSEPGDRLRFTNFLQILQRGFEQEALTSGRNRLSLSASLESDLTEARTYYQIDEIGKVLDFATLMAYDMHGEWDRTAGALHHSPLEPEIRTFVQGWIQDGFPANKLVLAVPGFGRSFTLTSQPNGSGIGQAVSGGGTAGTLSNESGLLDYGEICSYINRDGWSRIWLPDRGVPVAYGNTTDGWQWVGYDDPQSLSGKAAFIRNQGLAGMAFWSLEHDDFSNLCQNGTWPLLRAMARELPSNSSQATTTTPRVRPTQTSATRGNGSATTTSTTADRRGPQPTRSTPTTTTTQPMVINNSSETTTVKSPGAPGNESIESEGTDQQCRISENIGTSLTCPTTRGKPGERNTFFLFCFTGFFAIECRCLPGHFFNRCLQTCDINDNFKNCPLLH